MITPTSTARSENYIGADATVAIPASNGFVISIPNGLSPSFVLSLSSALVVDSAAMATFSEPQYVGTAGSSAQTRTAEPSGTENTSKAIGKTLPTHKIVIIAIAVSFGLVCAFSLFIGVVKCRNRRQSRSEIKSHTRKARDSLEIRCIGIDHDVRAKGISPAGLSKAGVVETKEPRRMAQIII